MMQRRCEASEICVRSPEAQIVLPDGHPVEYCTPHLENVRKEARESVRKVLELGMEDSSPRIINMLATFVVNDLFRVTSVVE